MYERGTSNIMVEAFTYADWGSDIDDRLSVSGVMIKVSNESVVFKWNFQRTRT